MWQKKIYQGSLTVEASLIFPIFIFAVIAFLSFFQIMLIQGRVQWALMETSLEASRYAYVYQDIMEEDKIERADTKQTYQNVLGHLEDGLFYQQCFQKYMKDGNGNRLYNKNFLTGGFSFVQSEFLQDGKNVDVVVTYQIKLPIQVLTGKTFTFVQRSKVRGFIGTTAFGTEDGNKGKENDRLVYITDTGTVYHTSENCTHLKLNISNISFSGIPDARSQNGGKYKPCEKCVKNISLSKEAVVYIAAEGDRYHNNRNCSGLKRSVRTIKLSEAGGRRPCSRCGGRE